MLKTYCKTAFRALIRHRAFSFINIAGLTLGLGASMLITLFVLDEFQYDKFIPKGEAVYRVYNEVTNNQGTENVSVTPPLFASVLQKEFPQIEKTARVLEGPDFKVLVEGGGKQIYEQVGYFADSTFFAVFPLSFDIGSSDGSLDDPGSIVISNEMADRFFGKENPVGRKMLIDKQPVIVKGVFARNPKFHLQFNYLRPLSAAGIPDERMQSWQWQQFFTYVRVREEADVNNLQANFRRLIEERANPIIKSQGKTYLPFFQSLDDIHLHSASFKFDRAQRGNITYVNALVIIASFLLIIACLNFVNLSTAKSIRRAKEVGVRKTIGANKRQLILQFLVETFLLAIVSMFLAVFLTLLLLPWLNQFTNKEISLSLFIQPITILLFLLLTLVVTILAGFYPAMVLSGFEPVKVLKAGVLRLNRGGSGMIPWLRQSLVVVQFTMSVLLIICVVIVFRQVNYLHQKDLGFSKDQIMFFPMRGNLDKNQEAFKSELLQSPGISSVTIGYGFPGDAVAGDEIIVPQRGQNVTQSVTQLAVDYDYIKTLQLKLVAGRVFSKEMATDKDHAWIINETAVKAFGFGSPEQAIGQTLSWHPWDGNNPDSLKTGRVIGIVKDFNYKSLYDKIEPAVLQIYPLAAWKVAVRVKTANIDASIDHVRTSWNKFAAGYPIEYKFLDENFEQMYQSEDKLETLLWIFTGIAIFVACLGLFGLAAYTAETRRKEVGIRKTLGASVKGVVLLLSKDFITPVIISILIASPIGWYFMNNWLQHFAYRVPIQAWIFLLAGFSTLLITLLTIGYQAIRAAIVNPIQSLRTE
jgi:putative ABC transport system permease protein